MKERRQEKKEAGKEEKKKTGKKRKRKKPGGAWHSRKGDGTREGANQRQCHNGPERN
jgi:hypothetical protein